MNRDDARFPVHVSTEDTVCCKSSERDVTVEPTELYKTSTGMQWRRFEFSRVFLKLILGAPVAACNI